MSLTTETACLFCNGKTWEKVFVYHAPPGDEIHFRFSSSKPYYREIWKCAKCGHYISVHDMGGAGLYQEEYVTSTYGELEKMQQAFNRITRLEPSQSDNAGRVRWILDAVKRNGQTARESAVPPQVLDIGSGLCVFLFKMKEAGWHGTALDPDSRAVTHAKTCVGVDAIQEDFMKFRSSQHYDLITLNKVLEHVEDPVAMLRKTKDHLKPDGFVYVELPDGERAARDNPAREEFAIDHHHIFSLQSAEFLAKCAGFEICEIERCREPSSKYTLRLFLKKRGEMS